MTSTRTEPGTDAPTSLFGQVGLPYFVIAFIARTPYAMIVVGVLTLVVSGRDSLALGGLTSAMVGLGVALFGPLLGALADRFGQRLVLTVAAVLNTVTLLAMAWAVPSAAPDAAVLAVGLLIGATAPQVGPLSRSRLVGVAVRELPTVGRDRLLGRTMAYESAADEVVFVLGPVVVGVLAAAVSPVAPVVLAAAITLTVVTAFALHPTADAALGHDADPDGQAPARELVAPAVLVVLLGVLGIGLFFGSSLTGLSAYMDTLGRSDQTGLLYGFMGIGSAVFALAMMLVPERFSLRARWLVFGTVMVAGAVLMAVSGTIPMLAIALVLAGVGIGPCLVTLYSLAAARSPRGRSATIMTMVGSAVIVGQSAASAINGRVGETLGAQAAVFGPIVAAAVVLVAGIGNWVLSRRGSV